jgi:hypothetical protein
VRAYLCSLGHIYGRSTFDKLCSPAVNQGPQPDGWCGARALYDPQVAVEWAEARLRSERPAYVVPKSPGRPRKLAAAESQPSPTPAD